MAFRKYWILAIASVLTVTTPSIQSFCWDSYEAIDDTQEFQATGLVKLNAQELKAPDEWLARFASVVITVLCQTQSVTIQ